MLKGTKPRFLKTKLPHQDFAEKILSKYRFFRRDFLGGASLIFRKKVNSKAKYDAPLHRFMLNIRWQFPGLTDEGPSISGAKSLTFTKQPLYIFQKQYLQQIEDRHFNNKTGQEHIITRVLRSARPLTLKRMDLKASDEAVQLPGRERTVSEAIDLTIKTGLPSKAGLVQSQSAGAGLLQKTAGLIKVYPAGLLHVYRAGLIQSLPAGLIQAYSAGLKQTHPAGLIQVYQERLRQGQPTGTGLRAYGQARPFLQLYLGQASRRAVGRSGQAGQAIPEAAGENSTSFSAEKTILERMGGLSQVLQAKLQNLWSSVFTYSALTQASIPAKDRQEPNGPLSAPESRTIEKTGETGKDQLIKLSAEINRQALLRERAFLAHAGWRGKPIRKSGTQEILSRQLLLSRETSAPLQYSIFNREISVLLRYLAFSSLHREPDIQGIAIIHSFLSSKRVFLLSNSHNQKSLFSQRPVFSSKTEVSGKESGVREMSPRQALITKTDLSVKPGLSGKAGLVQAQSTRTGLIQSLPARLIQAYSAGLIQSQSTGAGLLQKTAGLIQVYPAGLIQGRPTGTGLSTYGPVRPFLQLYLGQAGRRAVGRSGQAGQASPKAAGEVFTRGSAEKTILERMGGLSQVLQAKLQNLWSSIYIYSALTQISRGQAKARQRHYDPLSALESRTIEKTGETGKDQLIKLSAEINRQALLRERAFLAHAGWRGKPIRKSGTQEILSRQLLLSRETSAPLQYSIFNREISVLLQYSAFNNLSRELAIKEIALKHSFSSSKRMFLLSNSHNQKGILPQRPAFNGKTEVSGRESGFREMSPRQAHIAETDLSVKAGLVQTLSTGAGLIQSLPAGLIQAYSVELIKGQLAGLIQAYQAGLIQSQSTRAGLLQKTAGLIQVYPAGLIQGRPTGTGLSTYGPVRPFLQLYLGQVGRRAVGRSGQAGQASPKATGEVFTRGQVKNKIPARLSQPGEILQAKLQNLWSSIFTYSALTQISRGQAKARQRHYDPLSALESRTIEKTGETGKDQLIKLSAEINRQSLLREKALFAQAVLRGKPIKKSGAQEIFSRQSLFSKEISIPLQHSIFSKEINVLRQYLAFSSFIREPGIQEIALKHLFAGNKGSSLVRESHIQKSKFVQHPVFRGKTEVSLRKSGDRLMLPGQALTSKTEVPRKVGLPGNAGPAQTQRIGAGLIRTYLTGLYQAHSAGQIQARQTGPGSTRTLTAGLIQGISAYGFAGSLIRLYMGNGGEGSVGREEQPGRAFPEAAKAVSTRYYFPGMAENTIQEGIGWPGEILQAKRINLWSSKYGTPAGVRRGLAKELIRRPGLPENLVERAVEKRKTPITGQQVIQRSAEITRRLLLRETVETERKRKKTFEDLNVDQILANTKINETTRMDFLKPRTVLESSKEDLAGSKATAQTEINIEKKDVSAIQEAKIDINKIADKVYMEIERKIKSERQRRGM